MTPYTIGFDVGGTRLKSGGVTRQGKLLAQGVDFLRCQPGARGAAKIVDR